MGIRLNFGGDLPTEVVTTHGTGGFFALPLDEETILRTYSWHFLRSSISHISPHTIT